MPNTTRAIRFHATGGPEVLALEDVALAEPGPGQALVRHTAIGVNFIDTYHRSGLYPLPLPSGLGSEAAGVIEAVGPGVGELAVGARVAYCTGPVGSYAERRVIAVERLVRLPDAISDEVAAASMLKGLTAEYLIRRTYEVRAGDTVLLHAAAGGVGLIATQWLAHLGATVIGTVGSDAKAELARAHGCAHTIVYTREDFAKRVRELTGGKGVAVAYDSVGRTTLARTLDCVRPRGLVVSFGNASGAPDPIDPLVLGQKGCLYLTRPSLGVYCGTRPELLAAAEALFAVLGSGAVKVRHETRFALPDAGEAHRALAARETTGSVLLTP